MDKFSQAKASRTGALQPPADVMPAIDTVALASYVAAMTEELSRLTRASGLTTLAYLLDIAALEARNFTIEHTPPSDRGPPDGT